MTTRVYVDGMLMEWGEQFFGAGEFWGPPGKGRVARGGSARRVKLRPASAKGEALKQVGGRLEANAVRAKLKALVSRAPQVLIKVYGGGKGAKQVREHLRYIGRAGEVEVEDPQGFRTTGKTDLDRLAGEFKNGPEPMPEVGDRREALNIVLSMPEGTDPVAVKKAARDFAAREFPNHFYAMALHTIDTPHFGNDKNDPPSPNPHVHLLVKSEGFDGTRLNPRKADLHRWREAFAQALREHGVEAVATSRAHRLNRVRGDRRAVRQMKDRKAPLTRQRRGAATPERVEKARQTERMILQRYGQVTDILAQSDDRTDRVLARELAERFGLPPPTRRPPERADRREHSVPLERESPSRPGRTGTDDRER
jgi:hypothetical protein